MQEVLIMRRRGNDYEGVLRFVIMLLLLMVVLPIFGVKQICKGDAISIIWGILLIVIGVGFWVWLVIAA